MLFTYQAIDNKGQNINGAIDAVSADVAISSLQRRGFVVSSVVPVEGQSFLSSKFHLFGGVKTKDIVLLSRQMSTLFDAQVSALRIFRLLASEVENKVLQAKMLEITDDLQSGSSISKAMSKHPDVFSEFYVSMVHAGEESGKLNETFIYLADYLERTYELISKARNALIYPAFVVLVFISVMVLMLVLVIPNLTAMLMESGQELPVYTKFVISLSDLFVNYGLYLLVALIISVFVFWRWKKTEHGEFVLDSMKLNIPFFGTLFTKLYLSRISDNMNTMLQSAIPIVRALEITGSVIDNVIYKTIIKETIEAVKSGTSVSEAFSRHAEIPGIMVQMMRVGEESGELGSILKTLSRFYEREVKTAIDTLISLIEPAMVVSLGLAVGFLFASVLMPIYNISAAQ